MKIGFSGGGEIFYKSIHLYILTFFQRYNISYHVSCTILFMFSSNVASVRLLKRRGKRAEKCIGQSRYDIPMPLYVVELYLMNSRVSDQLSAACIIRHSHTEKKQWQKLGNTTGM